MSSIHNLFYPHIQSLQDHCLASFCSFSSIKKLSYYGTKPMKGGLLSTLPSTHFNRTVPPRMDLPHRPWEYPKNPQQQENHSPHPYEDEAVDQKMVYRLFMGFALATPIKLDPFSIVSISFNCQDLFPQFQPDN